MNMNTKIEWLPLSAVLTGGLNPRTHFDPEKIRELVSSFKEHGFTPALSHLLVRPHPNGETGMWELICGERRLRAAMELQMETVPCVVEEMTDLRVLELQLVENLQREGLSPLEEAEGYRSLLAMTDGDGKPSHSIKSLAEKIGRSVMHVKDRLSLCKLVGTMAGEALDSGALPVSHARLLARVPAGKLRDGFTRRVLKPSDGLAPIPYRQLERMLHDECMVELRGAEFDAADPLLLPVQLDVTTGERLAGGACTDCPFNTKNSDQAEGSKFHMCMNPECFREKRNAAHALWMESVTDLEKGRRALPLDEAEKVFEVSGKKLAYNSGLVELDDLPHEHDLKRGVNEPPAWKKLIRGQGVPVLLVKDGDGKVRELVDHKLALLAARENEKDKPAAARLFKSESSMKDKPKEGWEKEQDAEKDLADRAELKRKEQEEQERARRIQETSLMEVVGIARGLKVPEGFWTLAVAALLEVTNEHGDGPEVAARHGLATTEDLQKLVGKMTVPDKVAFTAELLLTLYVGENRAAALPKWAKVFGVDLKRVKKSCEAQFAAEDKAAAEKAEIAGGIVWKSRKEKADDFEWNSSGVCVNPDVAVLNFPKAVKISASVEVARSEKGWKVGVDVKGSKFGHGSPCCAASAGYSDRSLALKTGLLSIKALLISAGAPPAAVQRVQEFIASITSGNKIGKLKWTPESLSGPESLPDASRLTGLSADIVRLMTDAGPEGMQLKDIAKKLSVPFGNLAVWFSTTGKKMARKIEPGRYSVFPEVKKASAKASEK